ncbi:unnamed protein product [Symbiodinium sp. CCMP2592]|nr:unnamed protein product [Symbiodinium sp. CCMP2592]
MAASYSDSRSVFDARVDACGLPREDAVKVKAAVGSLRQLAFISSFTPGQADEAPLMAALKSMLSREAELAVQASFRALYHEAYAIVTSEMRQKIEKSEEPTARRLTQPERAERHEKQVAKLVGVLIKGPSEPSEALVDKAVSAYEQNELRYISWESCTSREQEVASERKKDTRFTIDEHSGKLKVENKEAEDKASTASEVHVLQALQRRSLALDQANLVEYTLMQQWSDRLLRARMDDPPPQYSRPSWGQLVAADKKLFSELRDLTRDGVQSSSGGVRPLDKHLPAVMMSYDVVCLLQPMPQSASGRSTEDSGKERPAPYTPKGPRKGAGKGKEGKGKGRMPAQLIAWGCTSSTKKGNPYCYGFQLGNCANAVTNNACVRGLHACAIPKCGQHGHGASTTTTNDSSESIGRAAEVGQAGNDSATQASQSLVPEHFRDGSSFEVDAHVQPASSSPQHEKFSAILQRCLSFFDSLPNESVGTKTQSHRDQVGKAFYSGMYSKGVVGLRTSVHRHPEEVRVLTSLIRAVDPTLLFSSLVVTEDSRVGVHKDVQNVCIQNLVIPMTRFGGGELLLEDPAGSLVQRGEVSFRARAVSLDQGPIAFDARSVRHSVNPSRGRRVVLIAYCLKGSDRLATEESQLLRNLGFALPHQEPAEVPLPAFTVGFPDFRPALGFSPPGPSAPPVGLSSVKACPWLCLELFAETGNMTSALRSFGFKALPLGRRAKGPVHVTPLDLSRGMSWQYVKRLVQAGDVFVVHLSPPARGSLADAAAPHVADFCTWLRSEFPSVHFSVVCAASAPLWKQPGLLDLKQSCIQVSFAACGPGPRESFLLMSSLPELRALGANLVLLASGAGRYMDYEDSESSVPRVVPPPATQYRRPGDSDEPLPVALQCTKVVPVFEAVLKKPRLQAGEKAGVDRENVLRRWLCVLSHSPGASRLGVLIWAKGESDPLGVVAQALAGKATSTLLKRARFSARFICWADKHHVKAFPVSLEFLVSFLKPLAAEARNSAIREAMETVNSWNMFSELRSNKVEEVLLLEGALIEGALDKVDRNISKLELDLDGDTGFIEVRTYEHKNCRLSSGPGAVLILVAPYHGLHQKPWGAAWAEAAKAVGFDFEKGHRGPLLPRLACDYSWSGDAIDANETTTWIRALLSRLQAAEEDLTFSSHGLKATPLSWTSKAGYSERTQLVLGHHSLGPSGKTQEAYAREVQAQPLRDLAECLGAIRQGVFHPDRTKSGMIAGGATIRESRFSLAPLGRANLSPSHESFECAPEVELAEDGGVEPPDDQDLGEQEDVHEASSSESESSGESEEETHYESFGAGEAQNAIPSVNMGPDLDIFQNPKTKSLHSRAKGSTGKLICGRSLDNMKPFSGKVFSSRWLCKQCTAGRPLRDAGAMASFIAKKQGSEIMAQTLVESKAVFLERAKRVGLPQEAVDRLVAQTIDTMAKLAFAPCQPGETPTEESLAALIKVGGAAPPLGSIAAVRHLVFEAQTLLVSQTKALVENKENEVKELAPAERRERIRAQANKLRGITMSGQTECSYASYDLCMKLLTDNCISYLSPAKFITREAELRSEKPRKELDVQASTLVVRDRDPDQSCDTSTALSLHHAMHRRSLALDLIGVTDYFRVQGFVDFLLGHLHQEPIAGSRATSVQQILHADRAAWMRLAELTPDGIRRDAAGALPLDSLWARLQTDPKVIFHLLPREGGALKRESTELKPEPTDTPTKKQRKGTGKGKTKTLREPSNLPEELKGLSSWTKTGKPRQRASTVFSIAQCFIGCFTELRALWRGRYLMPGTLFAVLFASAVALAAGQLDTVPTEAVVLIEEYHYQVTVPAPSGALPSLLSDLGVGKLVSITCGVYRSPLQFAERALNVGHPCDMCRALPDQAMIVLGHLLIEGPVKVLRRRLDMITQWKAWAAELEPAEAELHKSLAPSVAEVVKGKRLLLLDRIARSLQWPDTRLHQDMTSGFKIVGEEFPSGIFPLEPRPATLTPEELLAQSRSTKPLIWEQINDAPLDVNSRELFEITEAEYREKGWLEQPRTWEELELLFGDWLPAKRFGVRQRDKLRPIDDLAANGANSAFAACDKLTLRAFDELIWCATYIMRALVQKGSVHLVLSCGRVISGPLHDFWRIKTDRARPLLKTIDLKAAYKQLPLHPEHRRFCVVGLKHPDTGQVRGYTSRVLPFGAAGSVTCFNRVARLIQRILQEAWILNCNYFDDFPVLELSALTGSTDSTAHCILDLLGFECSAEKEEPFGASADVLGVTVDLSCADLSEVRVCNRQVKCSEVAASVDDVLDRGFLRAAEVASLFGRIQFLEGQLLGRMGRLALSELRSLGTSGGVLKLGDSERHAFQNLRERMLHGPPRAISARPPGANVIVFTDGACEPEGDSMLCSIGGVLYVESSGKWVTRYFGCRLPDKLVRTWSASGKKHLIGPVELYAVATARALWREYLDFSKGIFFIDHAGVHAACVNGSSHDSLWRLILLKLEEADANAMIAWYARVPSQSNPADPPSRGSNLFPVWGTCSRDHPSVAAMDSIYCGGLESCNKLWWLLVHFAATWGPQFEGEMDRFHTTDDGYYKDRRNAMHLKFHGEAEAVLPGSSRWGVFTPAAVVRLLAPAWWRRVGFSQDVSHRFLECWLYTQFPLRGQMFEDVVEILHCFCEMVHCSDYVAAVPGEIRTFQDLMDARASMVRRLRQLKQEQWVWSSLVAVISAWVLVSGNRPIFNTEALGPTSQELRHYAAPCSRLGPRRFRVLSVGHDAVKCSRERNSDGVAAVASIRLILDAALDQVIVVIVWAKRASVPAMPLELDDSVFGVWMVALFSVYDGCAHTTHRQGPLDHAKLAMVTHFVARIWDDNKETCEVLAFTHALFKIAQDAIESMDPDTGDYERLEKMPSSDFFLRLYDPDSIQATLEKLHHIADQHDFDHMIKCMTWATDFLAGVLPLIRFHPQLLRSMGKLQSLLFDMTAMLCIHMQSKLVMWLRLH